jgi:predicted nucleotidyltransferase
MDNPRDRQIDVVAPALPGETALLAVMEQSDRDVAAGRTVPLADVLAELDGVAARIEARLRARRA